VARKPVVLVTGAGGEVGHGLIHRLADLGVYHVLALDVRAMDDEVARRCVATRIGDILDPHPLDRLWSEFEIAIVFHLAALLSTRAEFVPETAVTSLLGSRCLRVAPYVAGTGAKAGATTADHRRGRSCCLSSLGKRKGLAAPASANPSSSMVAGARNHECYTVPDTFWIDLIQ